jgi:acyl CoA:acetate/3-ketoacid CoA transferase beta subunit
VFVPTVDMVSGVGYDRAKKIGGFIAKRHDLRRIVTNLAVLDFATPDNAMRLVSVHPGVNVSDVVANTGFDLVIPADVPVSRAPTAEEMDAIGRIDPKGLRHREIPS